MQRYSDASGAYRRLAKTGRGSIANIADLESGKIDFALVQSDVEAAARGRGLDAP